MPLPWRKAVDLNYPGMEKLDDATYFKQLDYLKFKWLLEKGLEQVTANPLDFLFLADESTYAIHEGDIPLFKERYGMEPAMNMTKPDNLAEPARRNTVLYQMDAYTEILRGMAAKAKAANPKIVLCDQVNIAAMTSLNTLGVNPRRRPPRLGEARRVPGHHLHGSLQPAPRHVQVLRQVHALDVQQPQARDRVHRLHHPPPTAWPPPMATR